MNRAIWWLLRIFFGLTGVVLILLLGFDLLFLLYWIFGTGSSSETATNLALLLVATIVILVLMGWIYRYLKRRWDSRVQSYEIDGHPGELVEPIIGTFFAFSALAFIIFAIVAFFSFLAMLFLSDSRTEMFTIFCCCSLGCLIIAGTLYVTYRLVSRWGLMGESIDRMGDCEIFGFLHFLDFLAFFPF